MQGFLQDLQYGIRTLRRSRGFTIVAILTLALGIGANTAIFAVLNGVLLHSLPYKDPGKLVIFWNDYGAAGQSLPAVSPPDYEDYLQRARQFDELAAASSERDVRDNVRPVARVRERPFERAVERGERTLAVVEDEANVAKVGLDLDERV